MQDIAEVDILPVVFFLSCTQCRQFGYKGERILLLKQHPFSKHITIKFKAPQSSKTTTTLNKMKFTGAIVSILATTSVAATVPVYNATAVALGTI